MSGVAMASAASSGEAEDGRAEEPLSGIHSTVGGQTWKQGGNGGTPYGLAHMDAPGVRMRGETYNFDQFAFLQGCVSGPSRGYFRNLRENDAETWGRELPGLSVGLDPIPDLLVVIFGTSAKMVHTCVVESSRDLLWVEFGGLEI